MKCGIIFETVQCKDGSDYVIKVPSGDEIKLGPARLYLILGQEGNFPLLCRDDSLEQQRVNMILKIILDLNTVYTVVMVRSKIL